MSLDAPAESDAHRAFDKSLAGLRALLLATPPSVPALLTQAWICGHHAARAGVSLRQLSAALPARGSGESVWAAHYDDILAAAVSAHTAARQSAGHR